MCLIIKGWKGVVPLTITLNNLLVKFLFPVGCSSGLCWSNELSSQGRTASTEKHSVSLFMLEVETAMWPYWAICTNGPTGKERS